MNVMEIIKNNKFSIINSLLILFIVIWCIVLFSYLNSKIQLNTQELSAQKTELKVVKDTMGEVVLDYTKVKGNNVAIIEKLSEIEKQLTTFNEYNDKMIKMIKESTANIPELPKLSDLPKTPELPKSSVLPKPSVLPKTSDSSKIPEIPKTPEASKIPEFPQIPELPIVPDLLKVPELSKLPELPQISNDKFYPPPPPPKKDSYKFLKPWKWF